MRDLVVRLLFAVVVLFSITGIVGLTSYGCFPSYQIFWWIGGASSVLGTCCIIAISFSLIRVGLLRRFLLWLIPCVVVSASLLLCIWLSSFWPRVGPSRRHDLLQLASLIPLLTASLGFTPLLLQIYGGVGLLRKDGSAGRSGNPLVEYLVFALQLALGFLVPVIANLVINHSFGETGFFVIFSIGCIFLGSFVLYPLVMVLMKLDARNFLVSTLVVLLVILGGGMALSFSGPVLTLGEMIAQTTAYFAGLIMIWLYLLALRIHGYRTCVPQRVIRRVPRPDAVHPLDA